MFNDYLKTFPQYLLPKQGLTTAAGFLADVTIPIVKNTLIRQFIKRFQVDMSEALEENPERYPSFNEFFIRRLKPTVRSIADADVVSPVDGCISELGRIEEGRIIQAKGRNYSVCDLLSCNKQSADPFMEGQFATLYLSPKDYHRVHMPMDGIVKEMVYLPGKLFSVQPATTRVIRNLFAHNERLMVRFETSIGPMVMVMVGATIVGGIATSWHGDVIRGKKNTRFDYPDGEIQKIALAQGDEMGYFKLGSTVILLFSNQCGFKWNAELKSGSPIRLGDAMATCYHDKPNT